MSEGAARNPGSFLSRLGFDLVCRGLPAAFGSLSLPPPRSRLPMSELPAPDLPGHVVGSRFGPAEGAAWS